MDDAARRSKRFPSDQPLQVRCESWNDFVERYAGDISQGGMFIVTDDAPPIMSVIDVRMMLPENVEIALRARVVHLVDKTNVTSEHMRPGVGVEFVDLDAERKRQIYQMIEFARWQGADPNASFTRTMFETASATASSRHSGSLPPASVPRANHSGAAPDDARSTHSGATRATHSGAPRDPTRSTQSGASRDATRSTHSASGREDTAKSTLDGTSKSISAAPKSPSAKSTDSMSALPSAAPQQSNSEQPAAPPAKPSDPAKVKVLMTHFAHKRYDVCIKEAAKMLEENPGDQQALKWQWMCKARQAVAAGKDDEAVPHYEKALEFDESNREAREFVRTHHRDKRLNALPFGRYFVSKKK